MRRISLTLVVLAIVITGCTTSQPTGKPVLDFVEHAQRPGVSGGIVVDGAIANDGSGPARDVFVNVTWHDADGLLVGAGTQLVSRELKPGGAASFVIPMVPNPLRPGVPVDYKLSVTYKRKV